MALDQLIVIRHALSGGNRGNKVQGQSESELTRGYKPKVERLTDAIASDELTDLLQNSVYIFCSDSERAYFTAQWMHSRLSNRHRVQADLRRTELLRERRQGILEGLNYDQVGILLNKYSPPGTVVTADAASIYPHLFSNDQIPEAEKLENVAVRVENFVAQEVQPLEGMGIIVVHGISGNYLINLLKYGNIMGDRTYKHFPNLAGVKLELESFSRYKETGRYEPPNGNGNVNGGHVTSPLERIVTTS